VKLLVANWKMNLPPEGVGEWCDRVAAASSDVIFGVAPPFPYLQACGSRDSIFVAAQNCSEHPKGAFTGETSASMLAAFGASMVIVGHSERRSLFGETPEVIGEKIDRVLEAGLRPLLCVGEAEEIRLAGGTEQLIEQQLRAALRDRPVEGLVVAYEPVWAIGTGRNATAEIVGETHAAIRRMLVSAGNGPALILYGGSVTPENAAQLADVAEVGGFLVGGASLFSDRFIAIGDALRRTASEPAQKG
jgi:triosephosphate isomerase (TIM)